MSKIPLSAREFIQKSFSPCIAVLSSPSVDEVCQVNNLSFVELLEPFCVLPNEVSFKDPTGCIINTLKLRINVSDVNSKPPEAATARRLLNESVSYNDKPPEMSSIPFGDISIHIPSTVPWFERWRETFFQVQFPSDHEFTKHYLACMIVVSSKEDNPMDILSNLVQQLQHMMSMSPPKMMPKWFSSSILRYYVLVHDKTCDPQKSEKVFEEMKLTYNANCCHMLIINSSDRFMNDIEILQHWSKFNANINNVQENTFNEGTELKTEIFEGISEILSHPLSPELENQQLLDNVQDDGYHFRGVMLTNDDIEHVKTLLSSFILSALIPFVETQMQYLHEMVQNKKGMSKSIFSATKRWLGPKSSSSVTVPNAHYYHPDSPELHVRRLGDLCFMFGAYHSAYQQYYSAKRDFLDDGALLHYAGTLEMAALASFLLGQDIRKSQEYADESINIYMNKCRMPQFATRLTLCTTECLKGLSMFGEAAGRLLHMTSEDSDLRSALLLEEASYCFIRSRKLFMPRKYAFHLVLAGHRFSKAGQKRHSLRCYRQAYQVYENRNWGLAEDHIHFTIGKLASAVRQNEITAIEFAKLFERPSAQLPAQQVIFLKEYFLSLIEIQKENNSTLPLLEVPRVDHSTITVILNVADKGDTNQEYIVAGTNIIEDELSDTRWWKLEEQLVSHVSLGSVPMLFKPTTNIFSNATNNTTKPICVIDEKIRTNVELVNVLNIPFVLKNVKLIWAHSAETNNPSIDRNSLAETEIVESVTIDPDSRHKVSLHLIPKVKGELHITGIGYTIALSSVNDVAGSVSIAGYVKLEPKGNKILPSKAKKMDNLYLDDYRLEFSVVDDLPRLKIHFKKLPTEILCGEVRQIPILVENIGKLPIDRLCFTSSDVLLFSTAKCKNGNSVFELLNDPLPPGRTVQHNISLRGCDKSGRVSLDLLFYFDSHALNRRSSKHRLLYHTIHLLVQESLYASVCASRSCRIADDNAERVNFHIQLQNKNQIFDSVSTKISVEQISLYSPAWKILDLVSVPNEGDVSLEQEQSVFLVLRAERKDGQSQYTHVRLGKSVDQSNQTNTLAYDFIESIVTIFVKKESVESNVKDEHKFAESAISVNSVLIVFWKADIKIDDKERTTIGVHHVPIQQLEIQYSSIFDIDRLTSQSVVAPLYYNSFSMNELIVVRLKHPPSVTHCFTSSRTCRVPVELLIQNCCDSRVEVKLDATYHASNNLSKISESCIFCWLGLVLQTLILEQHSCTYLPLTFCVGTVGMYDLGTQLNVLARKTNSNDVFVVQSSTPHSLLCVTSSTL